MIVVCACEGKTESSWRASSPSAADAVSSHPDIQTTVVQSTSPWPHRLSCARPRRRTTVLRRPWHWASWTPIVHQSSDALWYHTLSLTATSKILNLLD